MRFKNDLDTVQRWLSQIGSCEFRMSEKDAEQINKIASFCMSAYDPQPGDKKLIGFFLFSDLQGGNDQTRNADGVCVVAPDGKSAAIGISFEVLHNRHPGYIVACIGLHEVAHLRYDAHDDNFASYLLQLQYDFFGVYNRDRAQKA